MFNPFFGQRQYAPRGYGGYRQPSYYRQPQPQYYDDEDDEQEYEQEYVDPYQAEMRRRQLLKQQQLERQEEMRRRELARRQQLLEEQRVREEQRQLKKQLEMQKRQQELERLAKLKEEEERMKREREEEEERKRMEWKAKQEDPQVRDSAATLLQAAWRGKMERNNRIIKRLKELEQVSSRIQSSIDKDHDFILNMTQNPLSELKEEYDEEEKKENKDTLWRTAAFEEKLTKALLDLDGISSGRSEFVRSCRKELVNRINSELGIVDGVKKMLMNRKKRIQEKEDYETSKREMEQAEAELKKELEEMEIEPAKEEGRPIQIDSNGAEEEGKETSHPTIEEMEEENHGEKEEESVTPFVQEKESNTDEIQGKEREEEQETVPIVEEPEMKTDDSSPIEDVESKDPLEEDFVHLEQEEKQAMPPSTPSNEELMKTIEELRRELKNKDQIIEELRKQLETSSQQPLPSQ